MMQMTIMIMQNETNQKQIFQVVSSTGGRVTVSWLSPPTPGDADVSDPYNIHVLNMFQYACHS